LALYALPPLHRAVGGVAASAGSIGGRIREHAPRDHRLRVAVRVRVGVVVQSARATSVEVQIVDDRFRDVVSGGKIVSRTVRRVECPRGSTLLRNLKYAAFGLPCCMSTRTRHGSTRCLVETWPTNTCQPNEHARSRGLGVGRCCQPAG
jgi:hypothetical protein